MLKNKVDIRGFTLIEIITAMFLLVVAFLGLISITNVVISGNVFSKMSITASALASDKMEDLKSRHFSDDSLAAGAHADAGNPIHSFYTRSWNVTDAMDAINTSVMYKTITLTVTWNWRNISRSMSLQTLRTNSS